MRVMLIRSTEIFNDSRVTKEITTYLKNNFKVMVIGWNRKGNNLSNKELKVKKNSAKIYLYNKKCNYGEGMKSIFKMVGFQLFILRNLIKHRKNYDLIHCCDFDTSLMVGFIARVFKKKVVYDIFDYYIDCHNLGKLKKIVEKKEIKFINNADLTIICTEQRKAQIKKANPQNLIVIHNTPSFELNSIKKILKSETDKFKIVYVGILQESRLLKEIGEEVIKHKDIELHIGGFGLYEEYFSELAKNHKNIYYYGSLDYADVLSLENECDVLFATYSPKVPNHKYSAPNKVYEAMCLGKPIIVCNDTGVDKLINEENIGVSVNYNACEFVNAVYEIRDNIDLKKLSNRAKKLYKNKYSWETMEDRLIKAVKSLSGGSEE